MSSWRKKRGKDLSKLRTVLELLQAQKPLPEKYRNHKLSGDYKDHWECHIEGDWLLIYLPILNAISLVRTGTHADLFE
jgi:mRNA interferase YafQ